MSRPPHWTHHPHHWQSGFSHKRRFLLGRFAVFFGVIYLIFLLALVTVLGLALGPLPLAPSWQSALLLLGCGVSLGFTFLALIFGGWAFRRLGSPVADVMAAADAVAEGDLSVRVRENAPGEFGRLARSFNRMAAELERLGQQRRNLTADVAHELRNPLHIIQGNLEGILDGVYDSTPEHISATLEETRALARLVDDLQTLSLAESGQLPLHRERVAAADLLSDVVASFAAQAEVSGIELKLALSQPDGNLELDVDPLRIDQVLSNLVANALRHTPAGGSITLSAQAIQGGVRLVVQDTGAGIPAEDLPFIFDRFWRGDRSRSRMGAGGSGLGLAIARQLVQAHGGRIGVESQPGLGAVFTIDLPADFNP
jgi:two-component system OmpR family sensor kinase/two-component system sensor histidine kinase BaeS